MSKKPKIVVPKRSLLNFDFIRPFPMSKMPPRNRDGKYFDDNEVHTKFFAIRYISMRIMPFSYEIGGSQYKKFWHRYLCLDAYSGAMFIAIFDLPNHNTLRRLELPTLLVGRGKYKTRDGNVFFKVFKVVEYNGHKIKGFEKCSVKKAEYLNKTYGFESRLNWIYNKHKMYGTNPIMKKEERTNTKHIKKITVKKFERIFAIGKPKKKKWYEED